MARLLRAERMERITLLCQSDSAFMLTAITGDESWISNYELELYCSFQ